jgi:hypothetical protein
MLNNTGLFRQSCSRTLREMAHPGHMLGPNYSANYLQPSHDGYPVGKPKCLHTTGKI